MKKTKKPLTAREHAFTILTQAGTKTPIQQIINNTFTQNTISKKDTALITELVYGYLRLEIRITWLLKQFLNNPKKLPNPLYTILGIAVYEILYLDKIPSYASIHTAVQTTHKMFGKPLAQVTNATLRTILRQCETDDTPQHIDFYKKRIPNYEHHLSIFYSLPDWIIILWLKYYGKEKTHDLAAASICTPLTCIRINIRQQEWEKIYNDFSSSGGNPIGLSGLRFEAKKQPHLLQEYIKQGKISLQGAGTQEILSALDVHSWETPIWDACAGVGGKTLMLLEQGIPIFAASDISFKKTKKLKEECKRLGIPFTKFLCASAAHKNFYAPNNNVQKKPKTILLDVPCSGLGTLARHPDIRRLRSLEDLSNLIQIQKELIDTAWNQLPANGHLVYITCTVNPEENEQQVARLLKLHRNAELEKQWESKPDNLGSDIMFGAVVRKKVPT